MKSGVARGLINTWAASTKMCHKFAYVFGKLYAYAYIFFKYF